MGLFSKGDSVTVANPVQPTGHKGGETGTVTRTTGDLVEIQEPNGQLVTVYDTEITHTC